jgi:hypothetical protein
LNSATVSKKRAMISAHKETVVYLKFDLEHEADEINPMNLHRKRTAAEVFFFFSSQTKAIHEIGITA